MLDTEKMSNCAEALSGLTYYEWLHLRGAVDQEFGIKEGEFKRTLKLPPAETLREDLKRLFDLA